MAETGKKPDPAVTTESTNKEVKESPRASYLVKTVWPNASFDLPDDDVPMITSEGTKLTKAQLDTVQASAEANGVELTVEDVNN